MKNEKHKVNSLVKRVCLVLSLLTPGSSMMVIASDEIAIVQQTGNITVTGTVVAQTGEHVIGVNVLVKGSTNGTITDIDGKFSLKGVSPNSILTVSYIGYKTETVNLNGKKVLQIILKEDSEMLNEVVVVGYGTQKKVNMSGAVDAVSSKVLETVRYPMLGSVCKELYPTSTLQSRMVMPIPRRNIIFAVLVLSTVIRPNP